MFKPEESDMVRAEQAGRANQKNRAGQTIQAHQTTRREFAKKVALATAVLPLAGSVIPAAAKGILGEQGREPGPHSWKINLFSKHLQFLGYDDMAAASVEAGVDGVDLTVRPGGHVLPENVERDLPKAAKAVHGAGLDLTMMTTRITDPDDPVTEKILSTASGLGIKYYRLGYYRFVKGAGVESNLAVIRDKMERLATLNEKYGIHGAYQNHSGNYFGAAVWDLWEVIRKLDPEWTGCQHDIRHAVVEGAYSWPVVLELLKEHVRCLAIKDFHWNMQDGKWRIRNVPIGEGMVDFSAYFQKIRELKISGPISLHIEYPLYPDEDLPVSEKRAAAIKTIRKDVQSLKEIIKSI
jgi:sugar phosphate isomerase/epimerase